MFEMIIPGDPKQLVGLEGNAERAKGLLNGDPSGPMDSTLAKKDALAGMGS